MTSRPVVGIVAGLVAAGAAAVVWWPAAHSPGARSVGSVAASTTPVVRTTLTTTTQLSGTLGHAAGRSITSEVPGVLTWLPQPGSVLRRGARALEIDGTPSYLLYGSRPAWRPFAVGMPPGPDVQQLEENLDALGYGAGLTVDDTFTAATARAVRAWQRATGQQVTGRLDLGAVAFSDGAVRVAADVGSVGQRAQPGEPVLSTATLEPDVVVPVPVTETYLVHRGDRVRVSLPSGATSGGEVFSVSAVASSGNEPGQGSTPPTVSTSVRMDRPEVAGGLDQAPVTVTITDRRVIGVLAVPVTALVALRDGGYAVWVDEAAGARHLAAVAPGLFADTLVQVTGPGLHVGDQVEVPAP